MAKKKPDYEQLGKMLESIYESGYADHAKSYRISFLKGMFAGLGGVIGATLVLGVLIWILSLLHYVPLLNVITDNVQHTLQQRD